jgi:hemolysin-activating ACP:hemolysin acyltransferase
VDRLRTKDDVILSAWRPKNRAASLGLAVEFLSKKPAFVKLQFEEWSQVLFYEVARGHFFFVVDQDRRVQGFLGWALTSRLLPSNGSKAAQGCATNKWSEGDCVIVNAFAAETGDANRFSVNTMRKPFASKRTLYFKRYYRRLRERGWAAAAKLMVVGAAARAHLSRPGVRSTARRSCLSIMKQRCERPRRAWDARR